MEIYRVNTFRAVIVTAIFQRFLKQKVNLSFFFVRLILRKEGLTDLLDYNKDVKELSWMSHNVSFCSFL